MGQSSPRNGFVACSAGDVMTDEPTLGRCTAERSCIARWRSGVDQACPWHLDIFDPRHAARIEDARVLLGSRMHLTIAESAVLADRDDETDIDAVA
jgi:hypothetical protein